MSDKRKLAEQDNDSQDSDQITSIVSNENHRVNRDKSSIEKKIRKIIEQHFDEEIDYKRQELDKINERIFEAQNMLDKLRVCIVCNFYSSNGQIPLNDYLNHPAVVNLRCEHLEAAIAHRKSLSEIGHRKETNDDQEDVLKLPQQQFDLKICVGNVSKYLNNRNVEAQLCQDNVESSQYNQDLITHKWMIYIRSPNCPKLDNYIKKVIFYLHPSYKPFDVAEVKTGPFQLARRGWGEFPVHVQIHFKDERNKRVDINHNLKLDWTQTGLQTFGGETSCISKMIIKHNDFVPDNEIISKTRKSEIEKNSQSKEEIPSETLQKELNSQYQIELFKGESLPRNLSSSSLSSNSNAFSPFFSQNLTTNLSPTNFISTEPETPSTTNIANFDEVFQNLSKKEETQTKSNNSSLDALLSLRPIHLTKPLSSNIVLSTKPTTSNKINQNSSLTNPVNQASQSKPNSDNGFLNSLNKKLVIFKVGKDNDKNNETHSDKINSFSKSFLVPSNYTSKKVKLSNEDPTIIKPNQAFQKPTSENDTSFSSKIDNFYSPYLLIEKIKYLNSLKKLNFEDLINKSLRQYPIIADNHKRGQKLPFSAKSIHEFYSWPYAKRRANEWIRAVYIKKKCSYLIEKYDLNKMNIWSTKSIVLWLRSHGYTPLEYQHMQVMSLDRKITNYDESKILDEFKYVDSLEPVSSIKLDNLLKMYSQNENDLELIDVVNIEPVKIKSSRQNPDKKCSQEFCFNSHNHVEPCAETKYVQELLKPLNFKTCTISVGPSNEAPSESNVFTCNLVERFLFRLGKRFAEDLIRQACSDVFFDSSRSELLIESSKRCGQVLENAGNYQKFPDYLNVLDIFKTINKHEKYDFLTNKYMARPNNCES